MQVYIARSEWKRGNDSAIWIGVENFTAEALLGIDSFASLYVWVSGGRPQLVSALRESLRAETGVIGTIEIRGGGGYVVRKPLRKCLPAELDCFEEVVGAPLLEFFSCYGERAGAINAILTAVEKPETQGPGSGEK
ncbi:MAG: hypothetical protein HYX94_02285 [Chloroflexi bacterium]|nr:hypothetical protein [Chloroflexota bacterium]